MALGAAQMASGRNGSRAHLKAPKFWSRFEGPGVRLALSPKMARPHGSTQPRLERCARTVPRWCALWAAPDTRGIPFRGHTTHPRVTYPWLVTTPGGMPVGMARGDGRAPRSAALVAGWGDGSGSPSAAHGSGGGVNMRPPW
jgi:hypothetical protein